MGNRKRSLANVEDHSEHGPEMQSRKTTLHLENQERAYVAASRRADRSLEARHQSALMASQVHLKRTGKTLRVTHQIVRDEEMYEEADDPQTLAGGAGHPRRLHAAGYRGRTLSQTDAYIAALIARKAGVSDYLGIPSTLFAPAAPENPAWTGRQQPSTAACNGGSPPTTMYQPISYDVPSDNLGYQADSLLESQLATNSEAQPDFSFDSCFAEPAPFPNSASQAFTPSDGSSLSDSSSNEPNYTFGSGPEAESFSTGPSSLWLEDFLVNADGEGGLHLAQNGVSLG